MSDAKSFQELNGYRRKMYHVIYRNLKGNGNSSEVAHKVALEKSKIFSDYYD